MEPVTHFLTGACLGRTGFNRKTRYATAAMCLAAEAPDIDMVAYINGSAFGFCHHRGFTHTVWGIPLVAAAVVLLLWIWRKLWTRLRPEKRSDIPLRWGLVFFFACIAGWSHILLDFTNNYGVRPFWPFLNKWFAWDIVFIIEPSFLIVFAAALTLPALFGLVSSEIGARQKGPRGRGAAIFALAFMALVWGVRDYQHRKAVNALNALEYQGEVPIRVGAFPYHTNPFKWHGVVETEGFYQSVRVDSKIPDVDTSGRSLIYYKSTPNEVLKQAQASYLGRAYMDWSRFPLLEQQTLSGREQGYSVRFRDLRFMYPESRASALAAYVQLDPQLRVMDEGFERRNFIRDRLENRSDSTAGSE